MVKTLSELHPLSNSRPLTDSFVSLALDMLSRYLSTFQLRWPLSPRTLAPATLFEEIQALKLYLDSPYGGNDK